MGTKACFDLNQTMLQWRASLAQSATMRVEEIDELESHLRDSIELLRERGLSEEEAFLIATRRVGNEEVLTTEFAKANPSRVWRERLCWMLTGVFIYVFAKSASGTTLLIGLASQEALPMNGHLLGFLWVLSQWLVILLPLTALWWITTRKREFCRRMLFRCLEYPVLTTFLLMLLSLLPSLPSVILPWRFGILNNSPHAMWRFQIGQLWQIVGASTVQYVVLPILFVVLLRQTLKPTTDKKQIAK